MLDTLDTPESAGVPQQAVPGYAGPAPGGVSAPGAAAASAAAAAEAASTAAGAPNWLTPSGGATKYTGPITKVGPSPLESMMGGMALTVENVAGFLNQFALQGLRVTLGQIGEASGILSSVQLTRSQNVIRGPVVHSTVTLQISYKMPEQYSTNEEEDDMAGASFPSDPAAGVGAGAGSGSRKRAHFDNTGIPTGIPTGNPTAPGSSYQI